MFALAVWGVQVIPENFAMTAPPQSQLDALGQVSVRDMTARSDFFFSLSLSLVCFFPLDPLPSDVAHDSTYHSRAGNPKLIPSPTGGHKTIS